MRRIFLKILAIATLMIMSAAAYGQSLGDVARENREKKAEDTSAAQPKVITNNDIQKDPDADPEQPKSEEPTTAANHKAADHGSTGQRSAQQRLAAQRAAGQWKRQIQSQKSKLAALQAQVDQLQASIQSANGSVQSEGPYNRYQLRQLQRVAQIQQQIVEQKRKLEEMQDMARHAGMHTAVYDP
jgi:predicted RNase H-like nuclease (RuvC/YqgF family)